MGGARCLVAPELFEAVVDILREQRPDLDKRHIVVSEEFEDTVKQVVERSRLAVPRPKRGSFKMKGRTEVDVPASSTANVSPPSRLADGLPDFVLVKRTFIHVPVPSSMRSASSAHPATA